MSTLPYPDRIDDAEATVEETISFYEERGFSILRASTRETSNVYLYWGETTYLGYTSHNPGGVVIVIRDHLANHLEWWWEEDGLERCSPGMADMTGIIMHEIGHALGLVHVEDDRDVMDPGLVPCEPRRRLSQTRNGVF